MDTPSPHPGPAVGFSSYAYVYTSRRVTRSGGLGCKPEKSESGYVLYHRYEAPVLYAGGGAPVGSPKSPIPFLMEWRRWLLPGAKPIVANARRRPRATTVGP